MQPWLDDGDVKLYHGDVRSVLDQLDAGIAQTCVTSPPYWGLRDYGTGEWEGGAFHDHTDDMAVGQRTTDALRGANFYRNFEAPRTIDWEPTCEHDAYFPTQRPQIVLDPFIGSGTTCKVARAHHRRGIGIDLSADYLRIAADRLAQQSLFA